ncbi:MAG: hypothetical protein JRG91_19735, partial [Deltaproteobacteria bacterium]|nr:hypothetical protein [Deltaproteobacteria bacterium]
MSLAETVQSSPNTLFYTTSDPIEATPYTGTISSDGSLTVSDPTGPICTGSLSGTTI